MKLHISILEKLIELPTKDVNELRQMLDELGLEVKGIEETAGRVVFNVETLANRGDHLSALGVAREISARELVALKHPQVVSSLGDRRASVAIRCLTDRCSRYALLEMQVPTDMNLRPDIAAVIADAEPGRHAIVHTLNYILLEIGQPMHAFDRDKIEGEIVVELTGSEEEVTALDGKCYKVPPNSIVIKDKKKIVAVAGVIGCENSMVTPATRRVLVESAAFDPVSVRKTARAMGISTDASYAFERGSDAEGVVVALKRLVYLTSGAGIGDGAQVTGFGIFEGKPLEKRKLSLAVQRVRAEMNLPRLADAEISARLKNLGYLLEAQPTSDKKSDRDKQYSVIVPSWRLHDVLNEDDLVEDFARAYGLNRVKLEIPPLDAQTPAVNDVEDIYRRIEAPLHGSGFFEVITKSLYSQAEVDLLKSLTPQIADTHVVLKNAIEKSNSHCKATNIIHLCRLAETNHRHGVMSFKAYEAGRLFSLSQKPGSRYQYERDVITLALSGRWNEHEWRAAEVVETLLLKFKGVLEGIFQALGCEVIAVPSREPLLHPGYQAALKVGRTECGFFGVVHPGIKDALECKYPLLYAELDVASLLVVAKDRDFARPVDLPAIRRDITLKLGDKELAGKISRVIADLKPVNLQQVRIVDNFKKPEEAFRRVSYRLIFQSAERTLEHAEVDMAMAQILGVLKEQHQLELAG